MQQQGHGPASRSSPTQSRSRRQLARTADAPDAPHDARAAPADAAHTRAPVLIRPPTLLESFSRNLRGFLPARVPRPRPLSSGSPPPTSIAPPPPDAERIRWAGWDTLGKARVLLLAYATGLQMWDTSDLGAVRELLNVRADALCSAGPVLAAAVVPGAVAAIAVLTPAHLTLYDLTTHRVINQVPLTNPVTLVACLSFIVVSTTNPHGLHIFTPSSLNLLHTISFPSPPIFASTSRLLAYACPAPTASSSPTSTFLSASPSTSPARALWSAFEERAFSRSAPAAPGLASSPPLLHPHIHSEPPLPWITVLDLSPSPPRLYASFAPFSSSTIGIAHLSFANTNGGVPLLCVAPRGGRVMEVFELRGPVDMGDSNSGDGAGGGRGVKPWHRYALRRGVTSAKVEDVVSDAGGRWLGVVTGRRTVHVFAVNREGGPTDVRAHLEGRTRNRLGPTPLSTELGPLIRLRIPASPTASPSLSVSSHNFSTHFSSLSTVAPDDPNVPPTVEPPAPLVLTFLSPSISRALPSSLHPTHFERTQHSSSSPSRSSSPPSSFPLQNGVHDVVSVQDMLIFDPARGELALRRLVLRMEGEGEAHIGLGLGSGAADGVRESGGKDVGVENLSAREGVVAVWALGRERSWDEVRGTVNVSDVKPVSESVSAPDKGGGKTNDFVSQFELTTHLPQSRPSLYLAHQFSFAALKEDYTPLLARGAFTSLPSDPLVVRRAIEVHAGGSGDDADEGEEMGPRASFDGALASAIGAPLTTGTSPPVLPMLPNGQRAGVAMLKTLPVRVGEGLGRIRREIEKVRAPAREEGVVFAVDEADEALFVDAHSGDEREAGSGEGEGEEEEGGWDDGAGRAVAEAEMFDEISAAGFMDEEQGGEALPAVQGREKEKERVRGKGRGKRRR